MKYLLITISILMFSQNHQKTESKIVKLLKEIKKENFELDHFETILKEKYCSKIFFETNKTLECKLAKSMSKDLEAKKIHLSTEFSDLKTKSINFIILGYGSKDKRAKKKIEKDFKTLTHELSNEFIFLDETFHKGGEAPEKLEKTFSNELGIKLKILRLFGGCFGVKKIIISISKT